MNPRVITVTLNPAIDETVELEHLIPGAVHRALGVRFDAGGKGINVAACLADWGVPTAVAGVLGRGNAELFEALFNAKHLQDHCLRVPGSTRTNIKLLADDRGDTTDINLPGLTLAPDTLDAVSATVQALFAPQPLLVLCGSLPRGLADNSWARLLTLAAAHGVRCVLDTSEAPLAAALALPAPQLPYAVKPNRHELETWAGRPLGERGALLDAACALQARGIARVVVSLGAEGALFVDAARALLARPPHLSVGSSVGAGDAMVAGLCAALLEEADLETSARLATGFAAAKLSRPGAQLPAAAEVRRLAATTVIEAWR